MPGIKSRSENWNKQQLINALLAKAAEDKAYLDAKDATAARATLGGEQTANAFPGTENTACSPPRATKRGSSQVASTPDRDKCGPSERAQLPANRQRSGSSLGDGGTGTAENDVNALQETPQETGEPPLTDGMDMCLGSLTSAAPTATAAAAGAAAAAPAAVSQNSSLVNSLSPQPPLQRSTSTRSPDTYAAATVLARGMHGSESLLDVLLTNPAVQAGSSSQTLAFAGSAQEGGREEDLPLGLTPLGLTVATQSKGTPEAMKMGGDDSASDESLLSELNFSMDTSDIGPVIDGTVPEVPVVGGRCLSGRFLKHRSLLQFGNISKSSVSVRWKGSDRAVSGPRAGVSLGTGQQSPLRMFQMTENRPF